MKYITTKIRSALIIFLLAGTFASAHAQSISADKTHIMSGETLVVSGSGFPPGGKILVWLDTSGTGEFSDDVPVLPLPIKADGAGLLPATPWSLTSVPAGSFRIEAAPCPSAPVVGLCLGVHETVHTPLVVTLGLSHTTFGGGTTVAVSAYGDTLPFNSAVHVWYDDFPAGTYPGGSHSTSASTDANGAFSTSLVVDAPPGDHFFHVGDSTTPTESIRFHVDSCWFQECNVDNADTICLIGRSQGDLKFLGVSVADCKKVDSNYTKPTPTTPNGGYDTNNIGPVFMGAGVLAAAANELGPPGTGCIAITAAVIKAEASGNAVPDKVSLIGIDCGGITPPNGIGLLPYIGAVELSGHSVPDKDFIIGVVTGLQAASGAVPLILAPAQNQLAEAAVAGAIACGFVNYYCNGSDITATILQHPNLQQHELPILLMQPPFDNPPAVNPCVAVGVNGKCWGGLIGWAKVACKLPTTTVYDEAAQTGDCEAPGAKDENGVSQLAIPGSAGAPDNSSAESVCATGTVLGLSIGYDGDMSFDITGPDIFNNGPNGVTLVNYHNFKPGPGGSEPPNGLDIEIPLSDRGLFLPTLVRLRPGMQVRVCGRWVADMHMLWNEIHPVSSLAILAPLTVTSQNATRMYGAPDPAFPVSYNGFTDGDTEASLGGALVCTTTATSVSPVASYPIACSGQTSSKYAITYLPATLTVTQAPLAISANNATRPYGAADPAFTGSPSGLLNGDTLASIGVNAACTTTATAASPVGNYPITCSGPSSTTNYTIAYQSGTLTISTAPLTIKANNASKLLNAANPALSASYSGFVNGDSPASLTGTLACTTTAITNSPVGSYPITCSGQSSTNYAITYVTGTLKVLYASSGLCGGDAGHQILQPINSDGTSVWKQGRTVPAKFRVCDANGVSVGTAGVVSSFMIVQIIGGTVTDVSEVVASTTPDTAFRWDSGAQQWIFNISTNALATQRTYVYAIELNDGSTISFRFGLR